MKTKHMFLSVAVMAALVVTGALFQGLIAETEAKEEGSVDEDRLLVIWTSGDRDVAEKMVFMYTYNAKKQGWFKDVRLLIWGPSSRLIAKDSGLQDYLAKMRDEGVVVEACKACADMYGVSDTLESLGVDVKYMGRPLTDMLKSDWKTLSF